MSAAPRTLGPYEIVRELGRGGMGAVYEVRHPSFGRRLALKQILVHAEDDALQRFGREAELLARLNHPGVVTIHQMGRTEAGPYLVTELVEGEELKALCDREGPMDPRRAAEVIRGVADALVAVHAQGVLHRDLKPHNVILRPGGSPVLLDFGLAVSGDSERLTQTGVMVGTPCYMPPEQADSAGADAALDARADVYGLGATLYHLLAGHAPFHDAGGAIQVLTKILTSDPAWPSSEVEGVPPDLEAVCRRAMCKLPADRYVTAEALRDDLDRFLRGEATEARPARGSRASLALTIAALPLLGLALALAMRGPTPGSEVGAGPAPVVTQTPERRPGAGLLPSEVTAGQSALRGLRDKSKRDPFAYAHGAIAWLKAYPGHPDTSEVEDGYRRASARFPLLLNTLHHPTETKDNTSWRSAAFWGETHALTLTGRAPVRLWDLTDLKNPEIARKIDVRSLLETGNRFPCARGVTIDAEGDRCYLAFTLEDGEVGVVRITGRSGTLERLDLALPANRRPDARIFMLSPDGSFLLMSFIAPRAEKWTTTVWLIPLASEEATPVPRQLRGTFRARIQSAAFSADGALALGAGTHGEDASLGDYLVRVFPDWKNTPQRTNEIAFNSVPQALAFPDDDTLLVATNRHKIYAFRLDALPGKEPGVGDFGHAFVAEDATIGPTDRTGHNGAVNDIAVFRNGTRFVSCSGEQNQRDDPIDKSEIRVWNRTTRAPLPLRRQHGRLHLTLSPSGQLMIVSVRANRHELWALDPP